MISDCASHRSMAYIIRQVSLRLSGKASGKKVPRQTDRITWEASEKCRFPGPVPESQRRHLDFCILNIPFLPPHHPQPWFWRTTSAGITDSTMYHMQSSLNFYKTQAPHPHAHILTKKETRISNFPTSKNIHWMERRHSEQRQHRTTLPLRIRHKVGRTLHIQGDRNTPHSYRKSQQLKKKHHILSLNSPINLMRNHSKSGPVLKKVVVNFTEILLKITLNFTIKKLKPHHKKSHIIYQNCKCIHHFIQIV